MSYLISFWAQLRAMQWYDFLDIIIVALLIYKLLPIFRSTGTSRIAWTVVVVLGITWLTGVLKLHTLNFVLSQLVAVGLIAIVVLRVKNWDTVTAALITGWEAVKQAFSVAGEWFNTNVIQPLVGFFTGLWDRICLIVTNVTTFISTKFQEFTLWIQTVIANVQAVFMGIDAFLLGVFATDWTNQFGAFGEVLNAFFANVENIWNAVKTIFNGIVEFVKGVFAGDWQKGCQREAVCFRKCCKGAMLPKVDDPRRRGVYLKKTKGGCLCGHEKGGIFFLIAKANI